MRRAKNAKWFEMRVKYSRQADSGDYKEVTEKYGIEALTFGEAEAEIIKEVQPFCASGEVKVVGAAIASYGEVWFDDREAADKFYKAKVLFVTIDEKKQKERKSTHYYLIQAGSVEDARKAVVDDVMKGAVMDYVISGIQETPIFDCYEHKVKTDAEKKAEAKN